MTFPLSFAADLEYHPHPYGGRTARRTTRPEPAMDDRIPTEPIPLRPLVREDGTPLLHSSGAPMMTTVPPAPETVFAVTRTCPNCLPDGLDLSVAPKTPGVPNQCPTCKVVWFFTPTGARPALLPGERADDMAPRFRYCMRVLYPTGSADMEQSQLSDLFVAFCMGWGESIVRHGTKKQADGWGARYTDLINAPGQPVPPEFHW